MAITFDERREINRRNSQHSTGPKSPEGKERARQNALKHGLRAETLALPGEDGEELRQLTEDWVDFYQPRSPALRAMLDRAAYATVQLKRCARFHTEAVAEQIRAAGNQFDNRQEDELIRLEALLKTEPADAVLGLKRLATGCRWLLKQWNELRASLGANGYWVPSERDRVLRLLGQRPESEHLQEDLLAWEVRFFNLFAREDPSSEAADWLMDRSRLPDTLRRQIDGNWTPDPDTSRATLRDLIDEQLTEITAREERLRREIEEPGRAGAADRALLLGGPEGSVLLRYERMYDLSFHRSVKVLEKGESETTSKVAAPAPVWYSTDQINEPATAWSDLGQTVEVLDITAARLAAPNEASTIPTFKAGEAAASPEMPFSGQARGFLGTVSGNKDVSAFPLDFRTPAPPLPPTS